MYPLGRPLVALRRPPVQYNTTEHNTPQHNTTLYSKLFVFAELSYRYHIASVSIEKASCSLEEACCTCLSVCRCVKIVKVFHKFLTQWRSSFWKKGIPHNLYCVHAIVHAMFLRLCDFIVWEHGRGVPPHPLPCTCTWSKRLWSNHFHRHHHHIINDVLKMFKVLTLLNTLICYTMLKFLTCLANRCVKTC